MFEKLLSESVQRFIHQHEHDDIHQFLLKYKDFEGIPSSVIANQINGRRKAKDKLPLYFEKVKIVYPPIVNLEQSSSQATAIHKTEILKQNISHFNTGIDLTGGFGVDTFFLSKIFQSVIYVEHDQSLLDIARHNHQQLGALNITYINSSAEDFISNNAQPADCIFIDPSRRIGRGKIVSLSESEPDILKLKSKILDRSKFLLVKASPMLDIKKANAELENVKSVIAVSVDNEVKELIFLVERDYQIEPQITAENLIDNAIESFELKYSEEDALENSSNNPEEYLYEPNASILKVGAFKSVAKQFNLKKVDVSTHYYTTSKVVENFPGRIFKIDAFVKPDRSALSFFPQGKANITTRNYPLSVDELKKRTGLKDGGDKYLIGFSGAKEKFLVVASRLK